MTRNRESLPNDYAAMEEATGRLIVKLREFITTALDEDEREVLAALLTPAIAEAHNEPPEVMAFGGVTWRPTAVPAHVLRILENSGLGIRVHLQGDVTPAPPPARER